ncbi:uncharacterized protein [Miscanthus floridulus]|uniref:uncharacterized protein n=1 Tax=Miscanthus floridulus TaxID=154761 RepID=UPI00345798AA
MRPAKAQSRFHLPQPAPACSSPWAKPSSAARLPAAAAPVSHAAHPRPEPQTTGAHASAKVDVVPNLRPHEADAAAAAATRFSGLARATRFTRAYKWRSPLCRAAFETLAPPASSNPSPRRHTSRRAAAAVDLLACRVPDGETCTMTFAARVRPGMLLHHHKENNDPADAQRPGMGQRTAAGTGRQPLTAAAGGYHGGVCEQRECRPSTRRPRMDSNHADFI